MTDPAVHGSSAHRGATGQPLAEQPTTEVVYDRHEAGAAPYQQPYQPHPPERYDDDPYDDRYDDPQPELLGGGTAHRDDDGYDGDDVEDLQDTEDGEDDDPAWDPYVGTAPVEVRRADIVAGLLLLLAGMAAGVSLLVVWVVGGATGLELVRDGLTGTTSGGTGSWQPPAVVGSGIVLFVIGLLMYAPARTHQLLGVLALLVSMVAAAAVLVPLADAGWDLEAFAVGAWFAVAVAALGMLGALKAMSTGPRLR
ncbi:hypothetical protein [Modestobacter sp. URMC 112]